ncbi:DNA-directed RNA polymerase subunit A' [Candidatus Micrarchaeota archaeon]|nr:DNA-directed RNA polymerase subunit A' [Candidatus Micrarchaeota archaeon]
MLLKKITAIEFNILSPEDIRKMTSMEVKTAETYDKDGYPMEGGLMDPHLGVINPGLRCKTCGQKMKDCPGHFGSIELVRPAVHSEFSKRLEELLHETCSQCGRIVIAEEKLKELTEQAKRDPEEITKKILTKTKKVTKCPHCNAARGVMALDKPTNFYVDKERIYPNQVREWVEKIPNSDLRLLGYNPDLVRPEWFVLTVLPVPPITIRPSITLESGIKSEDDLTHKLVDIIRINQRLKDNIEAGAPQLIIEDLWDLLQYHITTYFDNNTAGVPPAKHRSGRALRTIVQRLKGKKGRFRHNLTGKRVNFAARSTISPDPFLSINQVGIPESVARELTVPEFVTEWNKNKIGELIEKTDTVLYIARPNGVRKKVTDQNKKEILEELESGFKIERKLLDDDIVLFNRQPSLHRLSMMAHKAKIMPGNTFRINPIVCKPYNADFDGDEMNLHVPQTEEGKVEAEKLMLVQDQILSPRYGAPVITFEEDGISGCFILSLKQTVFDKKDAMQYLYEMGYTELPPADQEKKYSGKLLFSLALPKDFNLEANSFTHSMLLKTGILKDKNNGKEFDSIVRIKKGRLEEGIIDAGSLGEARGKLVDKLGRDYPPKVTEQFYDKLGRVAIELLTRKGLTVGLDEYETSKSVERIREHVLEEVLEEAKKLVEKFKRGTLEHIPGRTVKESFEIIMMQLGAKAKKRVEKQLMQEKIRELLESKHPQYNTMVMILSKSRGNPTNVTNISGMWGQAAVREGRPKRGFKNRLITLNDRNDIGAMAGGFIVHNFMEGMDEKEFFYHAMGGRQGEVDTGVATKVSGYLYRRLANSLKDLVVANDSTVRTAANTLIQFVYGEDGIFPGKANRGNALDLENILEATESGKK